MNKITEYNQKVGFYEEVIVFFKYFENVSIQSLPLTSSNIKKEILNRNNNKIKSLEDVKKGE